jgi:hypothetical protein
MSQVRLQNTLGMQVTFQVPSTIAEFGAACGVGEEQAEAMVLKYALDEGMFRTILPDFRGPFFERLEQETGIARRQTGTVTKKVDGEEQEVPVFEKDTLYFKHVQAEEGKDAEAYTDIANEIAAETPYDLTPKQRTGKVAKEFTQRAEGLATAIAAGRGSWDNVVSKLVSLNPSVSIETDEDGTPSLESVARALKVDADRRSREQTADLI